MINFELPKDRSSIIKVIGIGGGGGNAVSYMYNQGIKGVDFVICNTDAQALELSSVPNKIQLGPELTEGRGSGANPDVGRQATEESIDEVKNLLESNTKMVFLTAGMGKGTGTGGAPVIAEAAREMGVLTVGIVTYPFSFEGPQYQQQAESGIEALKRHVDTLLVIKNDKLREIYGNLTYTNAFGKADDILSTAAKGIAEIITVPGYVNVDFEDVHTVMKNSGVAIMGSGVAEGERRASEAVENALTSPLLSEDNIQGAENILLNISYDEKEVLMDEIDEISNLIRHEAGAETKIIMGICKNEALGEQLSVTVIATGFDPRKQNTRKESEKVVYSLDEKEKTENRTNDQNKEERAEQEFKDDRQFTIEFDLSDKPQKPTASPENEPEQQEQEEPKEPYLKNKKSAKKEPDKEEQVTEEDQEKTEHTPERASEKKDMLSKSKRRVSKLKNLNVKLNNPSYLNEIEKEPAFKRRNVDLENVPHSSEQNMSRYTLSEEEGKEQDEGDEDRQKRPKIRNKNPYLHDNVD